MTRHLLPSPGSRRSLFPCFLGTMRCSDPLPPFSPHFVAFAWRYRAARLCSSLPQARRRPGGLEFCDWQLRASNYRHGNDRDSQVPGEPSCAYALLSDPGRTDVSGHYNTPARPPHIQPRRLHTRGNFGAQSHGLGTRCLRFARWVARTRRQTRFRLLAKLSRAGLVTRRVPTKGFLDASYISSSFPKLCLAQ
jgi:hypothetical protein